MLSVSALVQSISIRSHVECRTSTAFHSHAENLAARWSATRLCRRHRAVGNRDVYGVAGGLRECRIAHCQRQRDVIANRSIGGYDRVDLIKPDEVRCGS